MSNVVITGSTTGIGLAYARKFLELGDRVVISSRTEDRVSEVVEFLNSSYPGKVFGYPCDVTKYEDVEQLGKFTLENLGSVDYWINNAGISGGEVEPFASINPEDILKVTNTNIAGMLHCTHVALNLMLEQGHGHLLNMGGRGTNGEASPNTALYSNSKAGYLQLMKTLRKELKDTGIGINTISPGMVLTNLLVDKDLTQQLVRVFNILCILPSESADIIVPKVKELKPGESGNYFQVLTKWKAAFRFMTAWRFKNKYFDEETLEPLHESEDRLG